LRPTSLGLGSPDFERGVRSKCSGRGHPPAMHTAVAHVARARHHVAVVSPLPLDHGGDEFGLQWHAIAAISSISSLNCPSLR
jgi:hypothetical protein